MYQRRGTIEYSLDIDPQIKEVPIENYLEQQLQQPFEVTVFNIKQRKETTKERKAREALEVDQKKTKKKGKEDEEQEGPHMVKFVEYSKLDLSRKSYPSYSKWIGSIL